MEFLRDLRTLTIPWSTKAFAIGLLVLTVAANGALFAISLAQAKSDLVSSSLQFFGVLLPIILVVAVLSRADTGVKALKQRTEHLFLRVLPQALEAVGEHPAAFYAPNPRRRPPKAPGGGRVLTNLSRDECYGDISVFVPVGADRWTVVVLRLELNVRRINLNLCLPARLLAAKAHSARDAAAFLHESFRHSLAGAASGEPERLDRPPEKSPRGGYVFLEDTIHRTVEGVDFVCLVGSKYVSDEFLWNSAEQLHFSQDLMFMVRAFLAEAPTLFPTFESEGPPSSFAAVAGAVEALGKAHSHANA